MSNVKSDTTELDRIIANMPRNTDAVTGKVAFMVEGMAKQLAPTDTYALRQSINTEKVDQATYHVQDGVRYGIFQELGFHHHASGAFIQNPFMIPSLEHVRPKVPNMFAQELFK